MKDGTGRAVAEHIRRADHLEDDAEGVVTEGEIDEVKQEHKRVVRLFKPCLDAQPGLQTWGCHLREAVFHCYQKGAHVEFSETTRFPLPLPL